MLFGIKQNREGRLSGFVFKAQSCAEITKELGTAKYTENYLYKLITQLDKGNIIKNRV